MRSRNIAVGHNSTSDTGIARCNFSARLGDQPGSNDNIIAAVFEIYSDSFTGKGLGHEMGTVSWPLSSRASAITVSEAITSLSSSRDGTVTSALA